MQESDPQGREWELGKLVDALDLHLTARLRERAVRFGLTPAQASALRELTAPMTMSELAGRMGCEPSNATVVVDKLESLRLIERRPHPTDRRAKQLVITPEGTARRTGLFELLLEDPLLPGASGATQKELMELITRVLPTS